MKNYTLASEPPPDNATSTDPIDVISQNANADIFLFSSAITYASCEALIDTISKHKNRENVILILATYGGDPDSAYRVARFLQRQYKKFDLHVYGFCKSAGTLLALGAHEIVMGDRAEFGPLDVQMHKPDEFMQRISGLDITKALAAISDSAWESFQDFFIQVRAGSGGVITTKTASEIAAHVVTGLFSPITQNIDPLKLGEMRRSMDIAVDYGMRLGASQQLATTLASTYPTHGFVIDYEESHRIFDCVRVPKPEEMQLALQLASFFQANINEDVIRHPSPEGVIAYLNPSNIPTPTNENNCTGADGDKSAPTSQHANGIPSDTGDDNKPKRSRRTKAAETKEAEQDGGEQPATRS